MAIFKGSRYEGRNITVVIGSDNIKRQYLHLKNKINLEDLKDDFFVYTINQNDIIDGIMDDFDYRSTLWWIPSEINNINFPLTLDEGKKMYIPGQKFMKKF